MPLTATIVLRPPTLVPSMASFFGLVQHPKKTEATENGCLHFEIYVERITYSPSHVLRMRC